MEKQSVFARRCSIEALEDRRLLAGDVTAQVIRGNLVVTGDRAANAIVVTPGPSAGQFTVTGVDDAGGNATRVNGTENGAVTLSGVTGAIGFSMKDGDDNVTLSGVTSNASAFDLGKGNDLLLTQNCTANGGVFVFGDSGNDVFESINSHFVTWLKVDLGGGENAFQLDGTVAGRAEFKAGSGNDAFSTKTVGFDSFFADLGSGTNSLNLVSAHIVHDTEIGGCISNGDDIVQVVRSTLTGNLKVALGNGANTLRFDTCTVNRDAQLTTGNGTEHATFIDTNIDGKLSVCLGNGSNGLDIQSCNFRGDVEFNGGNGSDRYIISNSHFFKTLAVDVGNGINEIGFGSNIVDGRAAFKGGNGADEFRLLSTTFAGLNVFLGKGNDRVIAGFVVSTQPAKFDGSDGNDSYLEEEGSTNTFAGLVRKSFEIIGTVPPLS